MAAVTSVLPPPVSGRAVALREARAGLATAVGCVLLGAPAGLAWQAVTPRIQLQAAGGRVQLVETSTRDFMTSDVWFLVVVALAGGLTGALALVLARRSAVGAVVGLAVGGLLAAEVARRTGPLVGLEDARIFLEAGRDGSFDLTARLRAVPGIAVWPVAALVVHMAGTASRPAG